jgi:membrane protein implicated in regulation of membrane protease activity
MSMTDEEVTGRSGTVTTRIRGGDRPGEVSVAVRGGTESFIAYADHEIQRGQAVVVYRSRGARCVDVVEFAEAGLLPDEL